MSPPHAFPIFNDSMANETTVFHVFPLLPKELRLLVWRHALHRERIIRVHLTHTNLEYPETGLPSGPLEQTCKYTGRYLTTIEGHQVLSKHLRICRESREETLAFYRVHIPCRFARVPNKLGDLGFFIETSKTRQGLTAPGTFYFNPDWDFLHITCWPDANAIIPPFLHDLKTQYDPCGIGLRNLVIGYRAICRSFYDLEPTKLSPDLQACVEQTLRQLDELIVHKTSRFGRVHLGFPSHVSPDTWFNRSVPITTNVPAFSRVAVDPRPISNDLAKQCMGGGDWRNNPQLTNLLARFGILPAETTTQFKFQLSIGLVRDDELLSREDAQLWLNQDYEKWWVDRSRWSHGDPTVFDGQEYIMDVRPAFGFWLFPMDTGLEVTEIGGRDQGIFDMRGCVPQLGLSYMPEV
jgi:hypothetical protein